MISIGFGLFAIILAAIFVMLAIVALKKGKLNEEGEQPVMKMVFYYLVLFATLMMTIGGSVSAFMALADIVAPTPYYQSFENYKEITYAEKTPSDEKQEILSEEELRERYEEIVKEERLNERKRAINTLIKSLGWIIIPFPIFLYYQRRLRKT